jgi:hypothetical protein
MEPLVQLVRSALMVPQVRLALRVLVVQLALLVREYLEQQEPPVQAYLALLAPLGLVLPEPQE